MSTDFQFSDINFITELKLSSLVISTDRAVMFLWSTCSKVLLFLDKDKI